MVGRKDPLQELLNLQERINRLFEESLGRGRSDPGAFGSGAWVPLADVYETPDAYFILVELPGLVRDDIDITSDGRTLTVRGERRLAGSARPESFYRMERSYGAFARMFRFDQPIAPDRVGADLRNGLLKLELPKARPPAEWPVRVERGA